MISASEILLSIPSIEILTAFCGTSKKLSTPTTAPKAITTARTIEITFLAVFEALTLFGLLFAFLKGEIVIKYESYSLKICRVIYVFSAVPTDFGIAEPGFGHGIIASRTQRLTAQNAPDRKYHSDKKATFLKCLKAIG